MHSRPDFIFRCQTIPIVFAMRNSIPCANCMRLRHCKEHSQQYISLPLSWVGYIIFQDRLYHCKHYYPPFYSYYYNLSISSIFVSHSVFTLGFWEASFSAATNGYKRCAWWTLTVNWLEKTRWIRTWVHYIEINSSISFLHSASSLNSLIIINYEHLRNIIFRLSFLFSPSISNYPSYWQPKGLSGRLHGKISSWEVHFSLYYLLVKSFQLIIVPTPVKVYTN